MLVWFEIPARDLARATAFYEAVFDITTTPEDIGDGQPKSLLPGTGAIAQGAPWTPSQQGIVVYFDAGDDLQGCSIASWRMAGPSWNPSSLSRRRRDIGRVSVIRRALSLGCCRHT